MNIDGKTYIIYDKAIHEYHSFTNIYTINITCDYILSRNIPYISGIEAIKEFNNNTHNQDKINLDSNFDFDIYDVRYYKFVDVELCKLSDMYYVLIIGIDNKKFAKSIKMKIPTEEFIKEALRFHKQYELEYIKYNHLTKINNKVANTNTNNDVDTDDEKEYYLTEQTIMNYALEPKNKILQNYNKHPSCLNEKFKLKSHQQKNLKWWSCIEKHHEKIYYSESSDFEIVIGDVFYDPRYGVFKDIEEREYIKFYGGMLIDVVGTGKTLSAIISSVKNPKKKLKYLRKDRINSKSTLIICPSQVAKQWVREIKKFINVDKLDLIIYTVLGKVDLDKLSYQDLLDADFIITSQSFWNNEYCVKSWIDKTFKKN